MTNANLDELQTALNEVLRSCRASAQAMPIIHLSQLDAIASAAAGQPTLVYVANEDLDAIAQAEYAPALKRFVIWLHPSLYFGWRAPELPRVFYHEIGHIRAGHLNKQSKHWHPQGLPRVAKPDGRINTAIGQAMIAQREQEADALAAVIRGSWPYAAYSLFALLQGKEVFA